MNFTINQTNTTINSINVSLGGFKVLTGGSEAATCYVFNWTNGAWFSIGVLGTSPAIISTNITSQIPTVINASTKILNVYCTGAQFDLGEGIYLDFVNVAVNYNTTAYSNENCSDGTAVLTNDSWTAMTGASNWSNVSKVVNSTVGSVIKWCVNANDSVNNWNLTSCTVPFNYTTTATQVNTTSQAVYDSCTYAELAVTNSTFYKVLYDYKTYSELQLRNLTLTLRLYDYKTYAELLAASALHPRTFYDSVTYNELLVKASVFPRVLFDSATYAELVVKNSTFGKVLYDYATYAENVIKQSSFVRMLYDLATYAESVITQSSFFRSVFDSATYYELQVKASAFFITLSDYATYYENIFAEIVNQAKSYAVYIFDSVVYADRMVRNFIISITVSDAVAYAEMLVVNYQMFYANVIAQALSYIPPLNIPPVRIDFSWISVIILGCICVFGANYLRNRKPDTQDDETLNEEFPDTEE
jgi:hypothetical protein